MAKRRASSETGSSNSHSGRRLGVVMRFHPRAGGAGVRNMENAGFRVASSSDFRKAPAVPNDFGGADVQYFERFGIAIVREEHGRLRPMLEAASNRAVSAIRPERTYRMLGLATRPKDVSAGDLRLPGHIVPDVDYLRGYRDGINHLIDNLLAAEPATLARTSRAFTETTVTWGLEATLVSVSQLTGKGIKVAVLDTGFDSAHPDFAGRIVTTKLFASHSSPTDVHGHGTHCIGTACGPLRPAGVPRYGIAYEAQIFAGKVLGDDGFGTDRSIIAGMDWAVDQGCQIISMSLGAATSIGDQPNDDYEQIGQVCLDAGTLVVAAAGNESHRPGMIAPVGSPANASTILAVAAVDRALRVAPFSCGGMNPGQDVDIAAPGVDVLSAVPGGHDRFQGTSMATPHVAGVAALIAQSDAKFRGKKLWAELLRLAKPINEPARDAGKGFLQAPRK